MPTIITRGAAPLSSYGFSGKTSITDNASHATITFTSSQNFTVPAGVYNLYTVSGNGGHGDDAYIDPTYYVGSIVINSTGNPNLGGSYPSAGLANPNLTGDIVTADMQNTLSLMNAYLSSNYPTLPINFINYWVGSDGTWERTEYGISAYNGATYTGSGGIYFSNSYGGIPSGSITSTSINNWYVGGSFRVSANVLATTGSRSLFSYPDAAISLYFEGSTGNITPPTTTYTNIPVTPGAVISINIYGSSAGGSITITY
jgi:hypothetical protein